MNPEFKATTSSKTLPTLILLILGGGIGGIFVHLSRHPDLQSYIPETIALLLTAGLLYVIAAYLVLRSALGLPALIIILGAALAFRFFALSTEPSLSSDVYRYHWEGRVQRAGINPFTVHPDALKHLALENPTHPLDTGRATPTLYPPLSEWSFSWVNTIPGYKWLYTGLDVASIAIVLLLLKIVKQPLTRVLMYAWNPGVVVAFAMCAHHDSLAILALLAALCFIIRQQGALSIFFLALSFLSKFFAGILLPVFLSGMREQGRSGVILSEAKGPNSASSTRKTIPRLSTSGSPLAYGGLFLAIVVAGFLPYASAGPKLLDGLTQYAASWENNDSLFRLLLLAGNSKPQAGLVAGLLIAGLVVYTMKLRLEPLLAGLVLITGLLLLSPNAFPWYFTWMIPFLCFYSSPPLLLVSVICVLGYSPLVAYLAGGQYSDSPLMLSLQYVPAIAWLGFSVARETRKPKMENRKH